MLPLRQTITLFGDNWEMDMIIYLMYQQIVHPQNPLSTEVFSYHLQRMGVPTKQIKQIIDKKRNLHKNITRPKIQTIVIHWVKPRPWIPFYKKNDWLFISRNHFQACVFLYLTGQLSIRSVRSVAEEMSLHFTHAKRLLFASLANLHDRGYLSSRQAHSIMHHLWRHHLMETAYKKMLRRHSRQKKLNPAAEYILKKNNVFLKNMNQLQPQQDMSQFQWLKMIQNQTAVLENNKIQFTKLRHFLRQN